MFSLGYCLLVALGFHRILSHLNNQNLRYLAVLVLGLVLVISSAMLVTRNTVWNSRETLFRWE